MQAYLNIVQIVLSVVLVVVVLMQTKGSGIGGIFGAETSVFRTRRGVQKTLFQFTVALAILFVVVSLLSVWYAKSIA
ncbi:MAG: preprotein translocase subunit SecG [Chloroflexota bacterium]|nr:MAG: preprotein translocase subunit SecG [Chloroflexota bacterium]